MWLISKHPTKTTQGIWKHGGFPDHWLAFHFPSRTWHHLQFLTNIFYFLLSICDVFLQAALFFLPPEIKKRKQALERNGEVKLCKGIIYQRPHLRLVPPTPSGASEFPLPLFTLKIIYSSFLNRLHFVHVKFHFFFLSVAHNSLKLDPNAHTLKSYCLT